MLIISILLFTAAEALPVSAAQAIVEPDPKAMSQSEIRAFNAKLVRGHPYFIRCVKRADTGSLVKRNFSCRTNAQWRLAEERANLDARDTIDSMKAKASSLSN